MARTCLVASTHVHRAQSVPALDAVIRFCEPICFQPNKLPNHFSPLTKRGGPAKNSMMVRGHGPSPMMNGGGGFSGPAPMGQISGGGSSVGYPGAMRVLPPGRPPMQTMNSGLADNSMMAPPYQQQQQYQGPPLGLGPDQYRAKYPFHGQDTGQLSFGTGEIITVEGSPEDNWQYGHSSSQGKSGWFPVNYLERKAGDDAVNPPSPPPATRPAAQFQIASTSPVFISNCG